MKTFKTFLIVGCIFISCLIGYFLFRDYNEKDFVNIQSPYYEYFFNVGDSPEKIDLVYLFSNRKDLRDKSFELYKIKVVGFDRKEDFHEKTFIEKVESFESPLTKNVSLKMKYSFEGELEENEKTILEDYLQMRFGKETDIVKGVINPSREDGFNRHNRNYYYQGFIFYYKVKFEKSIYENKVVVDSSTKEVIIGVPVIKILTEILD